MSYYRPSQTVAMTRGRGFSSPRGSSYRGSSRGSSSWIDRGGRGSYSSSRGGGKFSSFSSSFESRPRYGSSNHGSGDRYSSSSRGRSDSFRRPSNSYRSEGGSFRDSSSHRSPERKRPRIEAPSSRRSHDGGGGGYSSANDSYTTRFDNHNHNNSGGYSDKGRLHSFSTSASGDRRPSSAATFRPREEYHRKPQSAAIRFRGGRIGPRGTRGSLRIGTRDGPIRRRLVESSYSIRRRIMPKSTQDYMRRVKLNRLRSNIPPRRIKKSKSIDKDDSDEKEDWDAELAAEEMLKNKSSEKDGAIMMDKDDEKAEKKAAQKKSPNKDKENEDDEDEEDDKKSEMSVKAHPSKRPFIHLKCPHCYSECETFGEYSAHLYSGKHVTSMRRIAMKQKQILARMRLAQRNTQREIEKAGEDLAPRTNFCPLCKLNYKQLKSKHQSSDAHKRMKKFLMPLCRVCQIGFKSPMLFENHICSLDHIKRKAYQNGEKHSEKDENSGNEDLNLENFMTIDSVGDVDDDEDSKEEIKKEASADGTKSKEKINVGVEHVRKVEVHFCELCRMYLPRADDESFILAKHCSNRTHLQKYVRYKEDRELRKQAERLQRKETAEKEERKEKVKDKKEDNKEKGTEEAATDKCEKEAQVEEKAIAADVSKEEEDDGGDDKLWTEDVDKDFKDLMEEVNTGNKSSDEDEEDSHADAERYDRFRYSKKNGEETADKEGKEESEVSKETKEETKEI